MTDHVSLFAEMDAAAEALRERVERLNREDLKIEFREIVLARQPELSRDERLELFEVWIEGYVAFCERRREGAIAHIIATSEEYARASEPADPSVCPGCGEVLDDPCSPAVMAIHQPHYLAAKQAGRESRATGVRIIGACRARSLADQGSAAGF
jgi:hypothetical protein